MATPRAIDLYSGIGGWTLGLRMSSIECTASYEWWDEANDTHRRNFNSNVTETNIREMSFADLPSDIDLVVGSPPCTQFSYSNRGGNGDLEDGLRDIYRFLEIVEKFSPRHWVMENVPRVAGIMDRELAPGGALARFRDLVKIIKVIDMSEFGLPQARKRMFAGDFPSRLLDRYKERIPRRTLGQVIEALNHDPVIDPIYGFHLRRDSLTDHEFEPPLDWEETRINHDAKQFHPVYNRMSFPDLLDRPSRAVTALCTRVSRESIVIRERDAYRRLTIRERASLQGFPTTFQLCGKTYQSRIKMVGNALPPTMAYYIACSMRGIAPEDLLLPDEVSRQHPLPQPTSIRVLVEAPKRKFPWNRAFEAAIPNLRFGSGVRFQLANRIGGDDLRWEIAFFHGPSKSFKRLDLGGELLRRIWPSRAIRRRFKKLKALRQRFKRWMRRQVSPSELQAAWIHGHKRLHPFRVVDQLGEFARKLEGAFPDSSRHDVEAVVYRLFDDSGGKGRPNSGLRKLLSFARSILAGLLIGCWFNMTVRPRRA